MNTALLEYINSLDTDVDELSNSRKEKLLKISEFIQAKWENGTPARLVFICTHNSRRSQLCQVWSATLAVHFGLEGIETYSGGTEVTAFNPRAVDAMRRAGFTVENPGGENPRYEVFYDTRQKPLTCYSKMFDDKANPGERFLALMTCSRADRNCPVVPGAEQRIAIPYADPGQADDTLQEARAYDERCRQIASEMFYMLSRGIGAGSGDRGSR